jgi:DNA-binding transcriptional MerR regulator
MARRTSTGSGSGGGRKTAKRKLFHKIKDVCELTSTEPYVLRYWEQEFPFLAPEKNKAGHRIYTDEDIELVRQIKRLLYDEGYTTAGARRQLERERSAAAEQSSTDPATPGPSPEAAELEEQLGALRAENAELTGRVRDLEAAREGLRRSLESLQSRAREVRALFAASAGRNPTVAPKGDEAPMPAAGGHGSSEGHSRATAAARPKKAKKAKKAAAAPARAKSSGSSGSSSARPARKKPAAAKKAAPKKPSGSGRGRTSRKR